MNTPITSAILLLILLAACDSRRSEQHSAEVRNVEIPSTLQRIWDAEFPGAEITAFGVAASPGDTLYLLKSQTEDAERVLRVTSEGEIKIRVNAVRSAFDALPEDARAYIREEYPGKDVSDVFRADVGGEKRYSARIILQVRGTWVESMVLVFDPDGSLDSERNESYDTNSGLPPVWDYND